MGNVWLVIENKMLSTNRLVVRKSASMVVNLAYSIGVSSFCIVIGGSVSVENHLFLRKQGFGSIIFLEHRLLQDYCPEHYLHALTNLVRDHSPSLIVFPSHPHFYDISSHLAYAFRIPVVHNCDNVKAVRENQLFLERVANNGTERVIMAIDLDASPSAIVLLRSDAVQYFHSLNAVESMISIVQSELSGYVTRSDFAHIQKASLGQIGLENADLILAGGGGVSKAEGWSLINRLAALLGAKVAGSRAALTRGFISDDQLIGISGKIVSPRLYMAIGISGSYEHLIGIKSSEIIVSVNEDRTAPICKHAHLAIVADLYEFLPLIIDTLSIRNKTTL